jgi:hypothetical protein
VRRISNERLELAWIGGKFHFLPAVAVWDGSAFVTSLGCAGEPPPRSLWAEFRRSFPSFRLELAKRWQKVMFRWKFGGDMRALQRATSTNLENWKSFGASSAFSNVREEFERVGLGSVILNRADEYLDSLDISSSFRSVVIEPCNRFVTGQGLKDATGLSSLMGGSERRLLAIEGGNICLVERLIELSDAKVELNARVIDIVQTSKHRHRLAISSVNSSTHKYQDFDMVILAAPLWGNEKLLDHLKLRKIHLRDTNVEAHATHVSTTSSPSPKFFNSLPNQRIPDTVLSTKPAFQHPDILSITRSIVSYRDTEGCLWDDECDQINYENVYRIFSRHRLRDADLARLFGQELRDGKDLGDVGVRWVDR